MGNNKTVACLVVFLPSVAIYYTLFWSFGARVRISYPDEQLVLVKISQSYTSETVLREIRVRTEASGSFTVNKLVLSVGNGVRRHEENGKINIRRKRQNFSGKFHKMLDERWLRFRGYVNTAGSRALFSVVQFSLLPS